MYGPRVWAVGPGQFCVSLPFRAMALLFAVWSCRHATELGIGQGLLTKCANVVYKGTGELRSWLTQTLQVPDLSVWTIGALAVRLNRQTVS